MGQLYNQDFTGLALNSSPSGWTSANYVIRQVNGNLGYGTASHSDKDFAVLNATIPADMMAHGKFKVITAYNGVPALIMPAIRLAGGSGSVGGYTVTYINSNPGYALNRVNNNNGSFQYLTSNYEPVVPQVNDVCEWKFYIIGTTMGFKFWNTLDAEPSYWFTQVDSTYTSGSIFGLYTCYGASAQNQDALLLSLDITDNFHEGVLSYNLSKSSQVNITVAPPSGGTAPYHWTLLSSNIPDVPTSQMATTMSGDFVNSSSASQSTLAILPDKSLYFARVKYTDSGTTPSSTYGPLIPMQMTQEPMVLMCIGDRFTGSPSASGGNDTVTQLGKILTNILLPRSVTVLKQYTPYGSSTTWGPNSTNLNNAITAANSAGVTHVQVMLGTYDAASKTSLPAFYTNMQGIINSLYTGVPTLREIKLCKTVYIPPQSSYSSLDESVNKYTQLYRTQIDALVAGNPGKVVLGCDAFSWSAQAPSSIYASGGATTDYSDSGCLALAQIMATAYTTSPNNLIAAALSQVSNGPLFVNLNMGQAVPVVNTTQTIGDSLNAARAQGFGPWTLDTNANTLTIFAADGTTAVRQFTLDDGNSPTKRS